MEESIFISGEENVKAVSAISRLYFWRTTAESLKFGFKPRRGWTIRKFNAEYGESAKSWQDVQKIANQMIQAGWDKS